uniref:DUF6598 domain-containing protein n=1 Tax=Leersia perrieri TaxID=77586 RepID=A0A0D9XKW1_9ORYZ
MRLREVRAGLKSPVVIRCSHPPPLLRREISRFWRRRRSAAACLRARMEEYDEAAGSKRERESGGESEGGGGGGERKKRDPKAVSLCKQLSAAWHRKAKEECEKMVAENPDVDWSDLLAVSARSYRQDWEYIYGGLYGSFDKTTSIPPMRYTTADPEPDDASEQDTLQIFCVKIKELRRGLQWPIHVFGHIAARDGINHNRNIIFSRTRDDCQTLTQEVPYLLLTGPSRAVVVCNPVDFEAVLKVKGSIESEDKDLSFFAVQLTRFSQIRETHLINKEYTSKLRTLELRLGYVVHSVEATINVRVTDRSWSDDLLAQITAWTSKIKHYPVLLLDKKMRVTADGMIELSRHVVSVESDGELKVSVAAFGSNSNIKTEVEFTPKEAGESNTELDVGFLELTLGYVLHSIEATIDVRVTVIMLNLLPIPPAYHTQQSLVCLIQEIRRGKCLIESSCGELVTFHNDSSKKEVDIGTGRGR